MSRVGDAGNLNHGGDVDDEPLTALPHGRNQALDESERAPEIRLEDFPGFVPVRRNPLRASETDACVVDESIDAAESFYGAPRQFRGLTTAREIRDESDRAASTLGFDSLRELIETIPAPCRHGQNGAFFRKGDGHRIADPARRAGDEQSLSSQFHPLLPPQMRSWRPITFSRCAMSFSVDSRNSFIGPKGDAVAW